MWSHGGLLGVVAPHLRVLPVRGGEEDPRGGQGDPEDPQAAEDEGEEGDQNPAAGSVTLSHQGCLKTHEELPAFETNKKKQPSAWPVWWPAGSRDSYVRHVYRRRHEKNSPHWDWHRTNVAQLNSKRRLCCLHFAFTAEKVKENVPFSCCKHHRLDMISRNILDESRAPPCLFTCVFLLFNLCHKQTAEA